MALKHQKFFFFQTIILKKSYPGKSRSLRIIFEYYALVLMIEFSEKTLNKKQKLSVILSLEQHSLQKHHAYCLHLISVEGQGLSGKFTVTEQPSLPGFNTSSISKAQNLPIERY